MLDYKIKVNKYDIVEVLELFNKLGYIYLDDDDHSERDDVFVFAEKEFIFESETNEHQYTTHYVDSEYEEYYEFRDNEEITIVELRYLALNCRVGE